MLETNPPRPIISAAKLTESDCANSFTTLGRVNYNLESNTNLAGGAWSAVAPNLSGTGGIIQATDYGVANQPFRYDRIRQ